MGRTAWTYGVHKLHHSIAHSGMDILRLRPRVFREARARGGTGIGLGYLYQPNFLEHLVAKAVQIWATGMAVANSHVRPTASHSASIQPTRKSPNRALVVICSNAPSRARPHARAPASPDAALRPRA